MAEPREQPGTGQGLNLHVAPPVAEPRSGSVQVMIADPAPVFLEGIAARLSAELDLDAVCYGGDLRALTAELVQRRPDATLIGLDLWAGDDLEGSLALLGVAVGVTRVILIYDQLEPHHAWRALHAGISGLLSRCSPADQFVAAIRQALSGGTFLDAAVQEELARLARGDASPNSVTLSRRERAVLSFSADGLTTEQIAQELALSPSTVKATLRAVYEKLGVHDRPAAVAQALRHGLIS